MQQKIIILDTSMLMAVGQLDIDIFTELERICDFSYEIAIIDKTQHELMHLLEKGSGKEKAAAKLALQLLGKKKIRVIKTKGKETVDTLLIQLSKGKNVLIATTDKEVKKQAQKPVITIRQRKKLELVWG